MTSTTPDTGENRQHDLFERDAESAAPDGESKLSAAPDKESSPSLAAADDESGYQEPVDWRLTPYCREHGLTDDQRRRGYYLRGDPSPIIVQLNIAKPWELEGTSRSTWFARHTWPFEKQVTGLRALIARQDHKEIERVRARMREWQLIRHHFGSDGYRYQVEDLIDALTAVLDDAAANREQ